MIGSNKEPLLITAEEVSQLEIEAAKLPSKTGQLGPRLIRKFIEHMALNYGIDIEVETEEMRHERTGKIEKSRKQPGKSLRLGGKSPNRDSDDF